MTTEDRMFALIKRPAKGYTNCQVMEAATVCCDETDLVPFLRYTVSEPHGNDKMISQNRYILIESSTIKRPGSWVIALKLDPRGAILLC